MDPVFYVDGYTRDGYVEPSPGIHGAVRFKYRPANVHEKERSFSGPDADAGKRIVALLAKKVIEWDIPDAPISEANLDRVHPSILLKMHLQIVGLKASEDAAADAKN